MLSIICLWPDYWHSHFCRHFKEIETYLLGCQHVIHSHLWLQVPNNEIRPTFYVCIYNYRYGESYIGCWHYNQFLNGRTYAKDTIFERFKKFGIDSEIWILKIVRDFPSSTNRLTWNLSRAPSKVGALSQFPRAKQYEEITTISTYLCADNETFDGYFKSWKRMWQFCLTMHFPNLIRYSYIQFNFPIVSGKICLAVDASSIGVDLVLLQKINVHCKAISFSLKIYHQKWPGISYSAVRYFRYYWKGGHSTY